MEIETMKVGEIIAIKSIEFQATDYPEIEIKDLYLHNCNESDCNCTNECDLYLQIRVAVTRKELFTLLGALKNNSQLWREENLPCKIKIDVNKKGELQL